MRSHSAELGGGAPKGSDRGGVIGGTGRVLLGPGGAAEGGLAEFSRTRKLSGDSLCWEPTELSFTALWPSFKALVMSFSLDFGPWVSLLMRSLPHRHSEWNWGSQGMNSLGGYPGLRGQSLPRSAPSSLLRGAVLSVARRPSEDLWQQLPQEGREEEPGLLWL